MTSTEVAERASVGSLQKFTNLEPHEIELVKSYVARGASDDELAVYLHQASRLGLDPMAREIWCVKMLDYKTGEPKTDKYGNEYPAQIMVGRDGFLAIAERSGEFDGLVSGVVKANDEFEFGLEKPVHKFGRDEKGLRGPIVGAYAYVYRKDRAYPFRVFAEWTEHGLPKTRDADGNLVTGKTPWKDTPSLMIKKVAESNALRLAFRVSGVVAAEGSDEDTETDATEIVDAEVIDETPARPDDTPPAAAAGEPGPQGNGRSDPEPSAQGSGATQSERGAASPPGASEPGEQGELEVDE